MREGILNEPVRESAEKLMQTFGDQMGLSFSNLIFIAISQDGEFRTANYSGNSILTRAAVKQIAKHLDTWADSFEE